MPSPQAAGADRDRHVDALVFGDERVRFHQRAQLFTNLCGVRQRGLRQDRAELLAAVAAEPVVRPQPLLQDRRQPAQHGVAGQMAVGVVDAA